MVKCAFPFFILPSMILKVVNFLVKDGTRHRAFGWSVISSRVILIIILLRLLPDYQSINLTCLMYRYLLNVLVLSDYTVVVSWMNSEALKNFSFYNFSGSALTRLCCYSECIQVLQILNGLISWIWWAWHWWISTFIFISRWYCNDFCFCWCIELVTVELLFRQFVSSKGHFNVWSLPNSWCFCWQDYTAQYYIFTQWTEHFFSGERWCICCLSEMGRFERTRLLLRRHCQVYVMFCQLIVIFILQQLRTVHVICSDIHTRLAANLFCWCQLLDNVSLCRSQ